MTLPLTTKQEKLWRYIASCERSPTYAEMMAFMGTSSKSSIHRLAHSLRRRGFVSFTPGSARSIVALDHSSSAAFIPTAELTAELARRGHWYRVVMLPLHGRIA